MNEMVFSAVFLWAVVFGASIAAVAVWRRKRRVAYAVGICFLIGTVFAALASAVGVTVYIVTGTSTVGTPWAVCAAVLRGVAACLYLGILAFYLVPARYQVRIETFFRLG